ncbi:MAG: aminoacyl-tRNA hydrolase [Desulfovibrionales bacterium]
MAYAGLIVGLGNPGRRYENTRHNIGFMVVDALLSGSGADCPTQCGLLREEREYRLWTCRTPTGEWLLAKPQTFMNLSGHAVAKIAGKFFFEPEQILVVHDELDFELGRLRFKFGGGLAGHNGLKSIAACLGSRDFYRLRLGIGRPEGGGDISRYVLTAFTPDEQKIAAKVIQAGAESVLHFCVEGFDAAVHKAATFSLP